LLLLLRQAKMEPLRGIERSMQDHAQQIQSSIHGHISLFPIFFFPLAPESTGERKIIFVLSSFIPLYASASRPVVK